MLSLGVFICLTALAIPAKPMSRVESSDAELFVYVPAQGGAREPAPPVLELRLHGFAQDSTVRIPIDQAAGLLQEREHLSLFRPVAGRCGSEGECVTGVARCRPSQTEPQLLCPAVYDTPRGESGMLLRAQTVEYRFPSIVPGDIYRVLHPAIECVQGDKPDRAQP